MIAVSVWLKTEALGSKLILQVHDELVLEVPDAELALVREQLPKLVAGVPSCRCRWWPRWGMGRIGMRRIELRDQITDLGMPSGNTIQLFCVPS